jgi:predicted heme/steroid binding protein
MPEEQLFTRQQLQRYDGESGPILIAYHGIVYDLSECPKWWNGLHEGMHFPGQDLTTELEDAPHGEEVFSRPCVRRVGRLSDS